MACQCHDQPHCWAPQAMSSGWIPAGNSKMVLAGLNWSLLVTAGKGWITLVEASPGCLKLVNTDQSWSNAD